jgi:adenine-specific DNA-methyltransferase
MEKLNLHSPDFTQANIAKLAELFPNCVTETCESDGTLKKSIDFDQLRQELSTAIVEGPQERYQLNWPGKREALLTANAPIAKTLRPCREESVDFDTTQNLFIEGDNLDALKLLQETYLGKVKMIYIDPPYNTGKEFIYDDDFSEDTQSYFQRSNQKDEAGNRMFANTEANGRFHSDWLSMIYPRLKLARNLLRDDGVIYISIGDEELHNLRKIGDEIFGENNYRGSISRATGTRMGSGNTKISSELDFIVIYAKSDQFEFYGLPMSDADLKIYDQEDERGRYLTRSLRRTGGENRREDRPTMFYPVQAPDGTLVYPIAPEGWESRWVCSDKKYEKLLRTGFIEWKQVKKDGEVRWQVYQKHYIGEALKYASNLWADVEGNKKATRDLNQLFGGEKVFDHPKPIDVIQKILMISTNKEDKCIVLDFFAGSGTTAHAVTKQNSSDNGQRRFIVVQLPEVLSADNQTQQVASKFCEKMTLVKSIAEICKERIRRAGKKIKSDMHGMEDTDRLDIGFRVLKIDSSNMKDVYYTPDAVQQGDLADQVDNIREGRSAEDLLFQVLLDWGVDLTLPITQEIIAGKTVLFIDGNALAACFDTDINETFVKELAARHPLRVVFRDAGFAGDSVKINIEQIFKLLSPITEIKVI